MFVKFIWLSPILLVLQVGLYLTHSTVTQLLSATAQWSPDSLTRCPLKLGLPEQRGSPICRAARDKPPHMSPPGDPPWITLPLHPFHPHVPRLAPVFPGISCQRSPRHGKKNVFEWPAWECWFLISSEEESKTRMVNAGDFLLLVATH